MSRDNIIPFPGTEETFDIPVEDLQLIHRPQEHIVVRVVLVEPPRPNPVLGLLWAVLCGVLAYAVVTAVLT